MALASAIALSAEMKIAYSFAFLACFLGIAIGDLGLYVLGFLASESGFLQRSFILRKLQPSLVKLKDSRLLTHSILLSRLIPGTRLPTYVGAGFLRYPFMRFFILTLVSVFAWVLLAFLFGKSLGGLMMEHLFLGLIILLFVLHFGRLLIADLSDPWSRAALKYSWRKWLSFEFWPPLLFYFPIVPLYTFLSIKHRSFFMPFYVNPRMTHGGLIGESKWEFLRFLSPQSEATLTSLRIPAEADFDAVKKGLTDVGIQYPFILKPDVGQRGFAVRIMRNDFDLTEYLLLSPFTRIAQEFSNLTHEAGIFYIRHPSEPVGKVYSITDKRFPSVTGDGRTCLGDLILQDQRARIIAKVYFARLRDQLDQIPESGEVIALSECGNHCQGAIFINGSDLGSEDLSAEIDRIAKQLPDFYFGRFDVKFESPELLRQGRGFKIVEINGAGAEATHIWDPSTSLREAYRSLLFQWITLFQIGSEVMAIPGKKNKVHIFRFFFESARVFWRKDSLSVSS